MSEKALVTRRQVADYCNVSEDTVDRWRKYSGLPYLKLPGRFIRFRVADIERWLAEREVA